MSVLVGLLLGLAGFGSSSAAIILPGLAHEFEVSPGSSAWVISLYALMLAVSTAVYGRVSDLVGIGPPLLVGVGLMSAGALTACLATSFPMVLSGRVIQGAGTAAVPTLGIVIVTTRYSGRTRAVALGRVAGIAAAVGCTGPLVGGVLGDLLGWRTVLALPILGVLLVPLLWGALPAGGTRARLDVLGAVLVALTAAGLVMTVQSPSTGPVVAMAGGCLLGAGAPAVAMWVRRRPNGFLPLSVLRNEAVIRSSVAAAAVPGAWFALLVAVPLVLVEAGWRPWEIGVALLPSAASALLAPYAAGPLLTRIGPAASLAVSGLASAISLLIAAWGAAVASAPLLALAVVTITLSAGLAQPALMAIVGDAVPDDVRGVALGMATLLFLVGGGVGSAAVGGLGPVVGLDGSLLALTLLPLAGLVVIRRLLVHPPHRSGA